MVINIISNFDFISPKITLFYEGNKRYSTTIGGIFTIIITLVGIFVFINQLFSFLNYDINGIEYYRKYIASLGYEINNNKNSIFIFINFLDFSLENKDINFNKIRLVGIFSSSSNVNNESFFERDHWLFANCNSINLESELIKLSEDNLKKAVCIKHYYNSKEKKYYSINDKNFKTPRIDNTSDIFNIYAHKCVNNSITNQIYGNCASEDEIINYIDKQIFLIRFSFLSHQINSEDYKNLNQLYINSVDSRMQMKNTYTFNVLTFCPLIIEKEHGVIFNNVITEKFYTFQGNKMASDDNLNTNDILNLFYIVFENVSHSYRCSYKTIYDLFARVTILIHIVYYILFFVNYIFNLFIAILNIQNVVFHKKIAHNDKIIHSFSENYKYNLGNKSIKIIKNPTFIAGNRNKFEFSSRHDISKNGLLSKKGSNHRFDENINNNEQINNNIHQKNFVGIRKVRTKYIEDKNFDNMIFAKKNILLFFKYLICHKWNNSPLLLFDSIQKKLLSVEHLFQMHLLLLYIKKNNNETNLVNIYKFFYE